MHCSGLVVTLEAEETRAGQAVEAIRAAGPFTLGPYSNQRLVVALEAATDEEGRSWHDWLLGLDGVVKVDVAFVSFDPPEESEMSGQP